MASADRMEKRRPVRQGKITTSTKTESLYRAKKRADAARKTRGMQRSTARSVGRTIGKTTERTASNAQMRRTAAAKSGRTTTSVGMAQIQRAVTNALTNLPGFQDRNSQANQNSRRAATRVVQGARARAAAQSGGTQRARSAQAREANRTRRGPAQDRRQRAMASGKKPGQYGRLRNK